MVVFVLGVVVGVVAVLAKDVVIAKVKALLGMDVPPVA